MKEAVPVHTFQNNLAVISPVKDEKGGGFIDQKHYTNPALSRHVSCVLQDANNKKAHIS
mgnify:CR=1 FL=1